MSIKRKPKREPKRVVRMKGEPDRVMRVGMKPSRLQRVLQAFTWTNIKAYWWSRRGLATIGKLFGLGFLLLVLVLVYYGRDLPSPDKINARVSAQTTKFYDRTGNTLLYEVFGDKNRSIVEFSAMGSNVKNATIAVEDHNFYKHGAFSGISLIRVTIENFFSHGSGPGGSTITQQYVKNALLTPDRTLSRKIRELILSFEIEQLYKKDDILKLYLNEIPYGGQVYGVQAAAKTYFNKDAKDLTLDEAATLASIPQSPTFYNPYGLHRDKLILRRNLVLDLMADQKYISKDEAAAAKKIDTMAKVPARKNLYANVIAPHFVLYVQELLEAKYGAKAINEGGYKIITSLDLVKQKAAEDAIAKNMANVRSKGGSNAALVSTDPKTGQVLAMVGSYDFNDPGFGAYNVAVSDRQPGSSFKPFVYSTLFKKNWGAGSTLYDVTTDFGGGYKPANYSGQNYGAIAIRNAIAGSLNIPAVKALYLAGVNESLATAHEMGITTLNDGADKYGLSLVLGSGEVKLTDMTNAYGGFANAGTNVPQNYVLKMTDPRGIVKEEFKQPTPKRVLDPQITYIISSMLGDAEARKFIFGNFSPLVIPGHSAAVKTGTTNSYKDAWTMGYTPSIVAGVWVGNNDNRSMTAAASSISAPIWHDFMVAALADKPDEPFVKPEGIKQFTLDADTGKLATDTSKNKRTDIFPSWYKPTAVSDAKSAKIDTVSGKLATDCTPPLAIQTVYPSEMHAEIPSSDPAYYRWEPPVQALAARLGYNGAGAALPTENDDKHSCGDVKPQINMTAIFIGGASYSISANIISGTFTANKVAVYFDDQIISTQAISGTSNYPSFTYTATTNGDHTFKAVVTDAGLYTGEDSAPVTISDAGGEAFNVYAPTSDQASGNHTFTWKVWPGATSYKISIKKDGTDLSGYPKTTNFVAQNVNLTPGAYSWYVQAYNKNDLMATTPTISFNVN